VSRISSFGNDSAMRRRRCKDCWAITGGETVKLRESGYSVSMDISCTTFYTYIYIWPYVYSITTCAKLDFRRTYLLKLVSVCTDEYELYSTNWKNLEFDCLLIKVLNNRSILNCMNMSVRTSQRTNSVSTTKTKHLIMFWKIIVDGCENHTNLLANCIFLKCHNNWYGQYHWALEGKREGKLMQFLARLGKSCACTTIILNAYTPIVQCAYYLLRQNVYSDKILTS
jgi:hypothetical protein